MTKNTQIKQSKDGTYCFRISLGFDPLTGKRVQTRRSGFKTKTAAKEEYNKLLAQDNAPTDSSNITFGEFVETVFLPHYEDQVKAAYFTRQKYYIDTQFEYFRGLVLRKIVPLDVQRWRNKLKDKYKTTYAHNIDTLLRTIFEYAVDMEILTHNPAKVGAVKRTSQKKIKFWTKEDFQKVISCSSKATYTEHFEFMVLWLLFMTGLRSGEARALRWEDINLEEKIISITKTIHFKNANNYDFDLPKTSSSRRTVTLDDRTCEELLDWYEDQKLMLGRYTSFVFSINGTPTGPKIFGNLVTKYSELAHVTRISVHGLRHSHASLLINMGENPLVIRDRLGHADIQTTLGTYGHLYPNTDVTVASKLNGLISVPKVAG